MTSTFFVMIDAFTKTRRFVAVICLVTLSCAALADETGHILMVESSSGVHNFRVEVMTTAQQRSRGLMFRRHLDEDAGMLFDFGAPTEARMWMKNTFIPLDMLFIKADGVIVNIAKDTIPHSEAILASSGRVRYVLEINAGLSAKFGIEPGDRVSPLRESD